MVLSNLDAKCLRMQELVFLYLIEAVEIFDIRWPFLSPVHEGLR
jgi:hypothetical protein